MVDKDEVEEKGKHIVKSAWKGSRAVATIVIGGFGMALGLKAFNSVSD